MKPVMVTKDGWTFRCHQPLCLWSDGKAGTVPAGHEVRIYEWPWKIEVAKQI